MKIVYSRRYHMDIGPHVFPTLKYRLVYEAVVGDGSRLANHARPVPVEPEPASWDELALVHTSEYLQKMRDGTITAEDIAQLELPWSQEMVDGFRVMVGGTIDAACLACGVGRWGRVSAARESEWGRVSAVRESETRPHNVVCHIGGGLHHAFPNHGEGFCPFNDVAVAVRVLERRGIERVAIVDLDVHHGNGTAFIFGDGCPNPGNRTPVPSSESRESDTRPRSVFTFSMHQQHNYPMWKARGSLDIGLADGAHDDTYLGELARALPKVFASQPQCVFYLAGADPYEDDQLGGLRLTKEGLRRRDRIVIDAARGADLPLVITLAGGYARRVEDTVAIHVATIEEAGRAG